MTVVSASWASLHRRLDGRRQVIGQAVADASREGDRAGLQVEARIAVVRERELGGGAGQRQERSAEVDDLDAVARRVGVLGGRVVDLGELRVDGHEDGALLVLLRVGDGPHHAVVVGHHGDRPAVDLGVSRHDEHDVVTTLVLQRGLQLDERAGHGQRVERRHLVLAQVEALLGVGERKPRPEQGRRDDGGHGDDGPEGEPAAVDGDGGVVEVVTPAPRCGADGDQRQRAGQDPRALEQGHPSLLHGEQEAERERQQRADRRQSGPAGVAGDLTADGGGEPGDRERQRPQLVGDVGRRRRRQQVGPSVDHPAGERHVGPGGGKPVDGHATEHDEGAGRQRHALAEQQLTAPGERHDGAGAGDADRRGGDEAPPRERAAEPDRRDQRHGGDDPERDGEP